MKWANKGLLDEIQPEAKTVKEQLSLKRVLIDGTILSVLLTIIIYGSIYINPSIWAGDYPPDIQAAVGDSTIESLFDAYLVCERYLFQFHPLFQPCGG